MSLSSRSRGDSPIHRQGIPNDDEIPPLSLDILTERNDKVDALKLIADSIAQQRQQAAFNLVVHPLLLSVLFAALAFVYKFAYASGRHDPGTVMMLASGVVMSYLVAIRYAVAGYIRAAEALNWDWLLVKDDSTTNGGIPGAEDIIIGTRYGTEIIGALVLRIEPNLSSVSSSGTSTSGKRHKNGGHSRSSSSNYFRGGKGVIRAWTTRLRYRGKGVGGDMLREAVRLTREKCGRDAEVGFAREHANSARVLPEIFNGPFRKTEIRAAKALEKVVGEMVGKKR